MANELILALPEGADDFVVYYDARSKDLEACLEKGEEALSEQDMESDLYGHEIISLDFEAKYQLGTGKLRFDQDGEKE
ncbi:hypothetical protein Tco_1375296 [Tanacetum coccineum]